MIKSMTGYGKAEASLGEKKITVEIRSLNSKQTDISAKMPSLYRPHEYELRSSVSKRLQRGKIDLSISCESEGANKSGISINPTAFASYYAQMRELAQQSHLPSSAELDAALMTATLRLPEVMQSESAVEASPEEVALLKQTVEQALDRMEEFRQQEGETLMADLSGRIDRIEQLMHAVTPYENSRTETVKNRIREHIASMNIPLDSNRLEQEMIFYIEKLDITEEKVRLKNHCDYFRQVAGDEEGAGRKLGFITQEIGREINTMGSKANEASIQKLVVAMKDELEKIKEQLLNIL